MGEIASERKLVEAKIKRKVWVQEGDQNSIFFHTMLKSRIRRNSIVSIQTPNGGIEGLKEIKEEVRKHVEARFK